MKRGLAITGLLALALLLGGAMVQEDKFSIRIFSWSGIDSDELFAPDLTSPVDMMNFDIGSEGGMTYIKQRDGFKRFLEFQPTDEIFAMHISQIDDDSERVVVTLSNGTFRENTGHGEGWIDFDNGETVETAANTTILAFKDTILITGPTKIFKAGVVASGTPGLQVVDTGFTWPYQRILVHQDRIYGYGTGDDYNTKLHWRPEFDIIFDSVDSKVNSGYVYIDRDDGDFISNVLPLGSHLVVYKTRAIYKVLVSPTANYPVEIIKVADNVGAYGYGAAISWNNAHFFVAEDGVYRFDGTNIEKISKPIDYWFADSVVYSTGAAKVFKMAIVNNRLYVTLPLRNVHPNESQVLDFRTFVYDLDLKVWWKYKLCNSIPVVGDAESHFMLRYEYSAAAAKPLGGGIHYGQRLIFVRDSSHTNTKDLIFMFPADGYKSDAGDSTRNAHYETALSPLTSLFERKSFERVGVLSSALAADTFVLQWYGSGNTVLGSTVVAAGTSLTLANERLPDNIIGEMLKYRILVYDTLQVKINAMEILGSVRGFGDETE